MQRGDAVHSPFAMNSYTGKRILALVRGADFAHAGEQEAIEIALAQVPKDPARRVLDAGCGRGGTASYMQARGWGQVTGIDIEPSSISYARDAFPAVRFLNCDIADTAAHVPEGFDLVTLFNVLYAISDQSPALAALASRVRPAGRIVIFDYVDPGHFHDAPLLDAGRPFLPNPLRLDALAALLASGGWRLHSVTDLSREYVRWYETLVEKIEASRPGIEALAGREAFTHVLSLYCALLAALREGRLGGALIWAEKPAAA
jgi:SAM-dependent methyltransferase